MRVGVLGTGVVGRTIATKLIEAGHEVMVGSRTGQSADADAWAAHHAPNATTGTFAQAAAYGAFVVLSVGGQVAEPVLTGVADEVAGKLVIDTCNPLDFSTGAPALFTPSSDSLAERLQRAVPAARVVKALNTINTAVMADPAGVPGDHVTFVAGDDAGARDEVATVLQQFGWPAERIVDLGDLTGARGLESYLLLWMRLMGTLGHANFNITLQLGEPPAA